MGMDPDPRQIGGDARDPHPHPARAPDNSGPGWGRGSGVPRPVASSAGLRVGPGHGSGPSRSSPHFPSRAESESRSAPPHWQAAGPRLGRSLWGQAMQPQAEGVLKRAFCMAYWQDLAEKGTRVGLGARPHSGTSKVTSLVSPRSTLRL